jgi:hypothetical protein
MKKLPPLPPREHCKDIILKKYKAQFNGMSKLGEKLVQEMMERDLRDWRDEFENLVKSKKSDQEIASFAERLMQDIVQGKRTSGTMSTGLSFTLLNLDA